MGQQEHPIAKAAREEVSRMRGVVEEAEAEVTRTEERAAKARANLKTQKAELSRIKAWAKSTVRKFEPQLVEDEGDEGDEAAAAAEPEPERIVSGPPERRTRSMPEWRADFRDYVLRFGRDGKSFTKRQAAEWFGVSISKIDQVFNDVMATQPGLIEKSGDTKPREAFERGGRGQDLWRYGGGRPQTGPVGSSGGTGTTGGSEPVAGTGSGSGDLPRDKDMRKAIQPALDSGATVTRTGDDHFRIQAPGKLPVTVSGTPSDKKRAVTQAKNNLRRAGYPVS